MALIRHKTDWRLWLFISVVIFAVFWFLPIIGEKESSVPAYHLFPILFQYPHSAGETFFVLCIITGFFAIAAGVFGWVIQCFVVIVKDNRRKKDDPTV